jgi:predicted alpha-1,6-mannanase (GH76 family)
VQLSGWMLMEAAYGVTAATDSGPGSLG